MRKAYNGKLIYNDQGQIVAVSLGAESCAEHEWGIGGLQREFGLGDSEKFGLDRRKITRVSPLLRWADFKIKVYRDRKNQSVSMSGFWVSETPISLEGHFAGMWTGWSERDFGVFSEDAAEAAKLRELYDSILRLDAAIWLGGGGVFQNAGLAIGIASRLPFEVVSMWDTTDRERAQLKKDAEATGIEERLTKAGLKWFALSPSRQKDGSVAFWLNPCEQDKYEACWATVMDLEDWILGTGKIVKNKHQAKRFAK
jgi:hypothetical protein